MHQSAQKLGCAAVTSDSKILVAHNNQVFPLSSHVMYYSFASQLTEGSAPRYPQTEADDGTAPGLLPVPMVEQKEALQGLKLVIKFPGFELMHVTSAHNPLARILHESSKP